MRLLHDNKPVRSFSSLFLSLRREEKKYSKERGEKMSRVEVLAKARNERIREIAIKNREKEKMKEREKEAKEKEARYTNGHLFNSITVSGLTQCYACNKSITAKEALICPTCNVTIHNRCKDTLANCTKVKQKQQKAALVKNSSALQTVALRNKSTLIKDRPSSAVYLSDSFRQSLLGSRRGRTTITLSKSVSTTNIAGNWNDDSPLGLRRILSQSTDSLNIKNRTLSVESLIDEGAEVIYNQLMGNLETDEKDFEADSWSLAVDTNFLQQHRKDIIKRQDVIYELIQTELHHVRTLKIMSDIFRKGMLEDLSMDQTLVHSMFPVLDELSDLHVRFLSQLLERRKDSLVSNSNKNFVINRLGDILVTQFSGTNAEQMKKAYKEFCSRHTKAVKLYKELFTRDKRFQQFIRRMTRSTVLRRHGIQECILLVTQRLTKYPVLIDRILQNTKGNEEDSRDLAQALSLIKDLIFTVDQEVFECEKSLRLQEIYNRVDSKAVGVVHGGRLFRKEEFQRRKLIHDGFMLWKNSSGRFKDVQVLLMTDVLVFLQEKDQKYTFPSMDKPSVISLQNLIVRDIANQERGIFLISAASPPEMYEILAASKDERNTWMKMIKHTVSTCPKREEFPLIETEDEVLLRNLKDEIQQKDREIQELLEERVNLFSEVLQLQASQEVPLNPNSRNLFRSDSANSLKGEKLITEAIKEVEKLKDLLVGGSVELSVSVVDGDRNECLSSEGTRQHSSDATNGENGGVNGQPDFRRTSISVQKDRNGNQLQQRSPQEEVYQSLVNIYSFLHGLQAVVVQQDTLLELCIQEVVDKKEKLTRSNSRDGPLGDPGSKTTEKTSNELNLLQRQHILLQEELSRCRKACEEKAQEARELQARLQGSEAAKVALQDSKGQEGGVAHPEVVMRNKKHSHVRRCSLPSPDLLHLNFTPLQVPQQRRGSDVTVVPLTPTSPLQSNLDCVPTKEIEDDEVARLHEQSDLEMNSDTECDGQRSTPPSPREYQRMQDITEEEEGSQEVREEGSNPTTDP
ncbi:rho guanine nucleotide exchange factor 2 isoform X2 [Latimeria chalumnae]|uniref:Rho guanine nucleotide exchange factor 2 n=1 Tax=Latimeria chalumnae TaxID=7897 RepID=H3AF10_LATCH|nr:PREDICTED: rho guanine nucleotide exchange factor 2 isoform X1 [Latimeria chalumnae]|eukprot:XP_006005168.1 PREDICTED: rho guanine nucleotide exchange factor 2 isoform X1 [Latimeria chalumnae]